MIIFATKREKNMNILFLIEIGLFLTLQFPK